MDDAAFELKGASLGYGTFTVIPSIDLRLSPGSTLALVGGNGSGKSTLLKTLAGLIPPLSGEVKVLGALPGRRFREVSYHGQAHPSSFLLPLRSIDIVRMARYPHKGWFGRMTEKDGSVVREAMERMGAWELAEKPIHSLSGGQRQRVFLAHSIARQGELVLLDEPTAGLDVGGVELYEELVRSWKAEGKTVLIATHSIQEASRCDRVLLLASRVVDFGTPSQVLNSRNLFSTFGLVAQMVGNDLMVVDPHHGHDHG